MTTSTDLQAWRRRQRLTIAELADLLGLSVSGVEKKLYGSRPIGAAIDRQLENINLLLAFGIEPARWPARRGLAAPREWRLAIDLAGAELLAAAVLAAVPAQHRAEAIAVTRRLLFDPRPAGDVRPTGEPPPQNHRATVSC